MIIEKAAEIFCRKKYMSALICGFIAVGALPPFYVIPCLFVAFSGIVFLINRLDSKRQAAGAGFLFGFGFFSLGLAWVSNALMIEGMGFQSLAPLPPLGFGLWGGLFGAAAAVTAAFFKKGLRRLTAFSAAWGILEWVRSWLFTGFPWNLIASVWTDWPAMLQTASVWGAYGLSVVTVFTAGLPSLITGKKEIVKTLLPAVLILLGLFGFGIWRLEKAPAPDNTINGVLIRLVQPNIPQGTKWSAAEAEQNLMKHVHLSRAAGAEKATHVIWPETATQFLLTDDDFARAMVTSALTPGSILLAGSLRREVNNQEQPAVKMFNSIVAMNDLGVFLGSYDKSHLVPFGEYVPLSDMFPFIRKLTPVAMDFSTGGGVRTVIIPRTLPVGMLVCYEVIFPGQVADKQVRPYWLLNVTNDGWYGLSAGPYQHFAAAQMRAVEEGLPLARAANTGISGMIDAYGRVTAFLGLGKQGIVDAGLPRRTDQPTFYAAYGNKVPLIFCLILLIAAAVPDRKTKDLK